MAPSRTPAEGDAPKQPPAAAAPELAAAPAGPELVKVRTTFRPWEEIEVPPDEAATLRHEGLLAEDKPAPAKES